MNSVPSFNDQGSSFQPHRPQRPKHKPPTLTERPNSLYNELDCFANTLMLTEEESNYNGPLLVDDSDAEFKDTMSKVFEIAEEREAHLPEDPHNPLIDQAILHGRLTKYRTYKQGCDLRVDLQIGSQCEELFMNEAILQEFQCHELVKIIRIEKVSESELELESLDDILNSIKTQSEEAVVLDEIKVTYDDPYPAVPRTLTNYGFTYKGSTWLNRCKTKVSKCFYPKTRKGMGFKMLGSVAAFTAGAYALPAIGAGVVTAKFVLGATSLAYGTANWYGLASKGAEKIIPKTQEELLLEDVRKAQYADTNYGYHESLGNLTKYYNQRSDQKVQLTASYDKREFGSENALDKFYEVEHSNSKKERKKRKWKRRGLALAGSLGLSALSTYVAGKALEVLGVGSSASELPSEDTGNNVVQKTIPESNLNPDKVVPETSSTPEPTIQKDDYVFEDWDQVTVESHLQESAYNSVENLSGAKLGGVYNSAEAAYNSFSQNVGEKLVVLTENANSRVSLWSEGFDKIAARIDPSSFSELTVQSKTPIVREIAEGKFMAYAQVQYKGQDYLVSTAYAKLVQN